MTADDGCQQGRRRGLRRSCNLRICFAMVVLIVYASMLMWINNYVFAISYNEEYTATFLPPPHPAPDNNVQTNYTFVAHEIAIKWKLTSADAPYLLEQQFYKVNDYNPNTDFLHFDHIPKTGGTSISDLLRDTLY